MQVIVDLIRVPDRAIEGAEIGQEVRGVGLETATYHPGLFLTQSQVCIFFPWMVQFVQVIPSFGN